MSQLNNDNEDVIKAEVEEVKKDDVNEVENSDQNTENTQESEKKSSDSTNKKKMSKTKKLVIFLSVFTVVSACITCGAIYYTLHHDEESTGLSGTKSNLHKEDNLKILSLTEKYLPNNITINKTEYTEGEYKRIGDAYGYYRVEINYDQISGLKDKVVQDKINQAIKDKVFSVYDKKYLSDKNVSRITITATVSANFSNVLSVSIYGTVSYFKPEYSYLSLGDTGINFRLDTGEELNFKDLFVSSANINNIVATAEYKELAWNELNEPGRIDMSKINTSDYEDEILSIVNKFKADDNLEFSFSPRNITLRIDGVKDSIRITMEEIYDSIAIYKRYKDIKNLYETSNQTIKEVYVFSQKYMDITYKYEDITDLLFVDCEILEDKTRDLSKVTEKVKAQIDEKINDLKNKNKNIGTAYKTLVDLYYNKDEDYVQVYTETYINTMSATYFKENIRSLIAEYERKPKSSIGGNYFYNFDEYTGKSRLYNNPNIKIEESTTTIKYDLEGNLLDDKAPSNPKPTVPDKVDIYQNTVNIY